MGTGRRSISRSALTLVGLVVASAVLVTGCGASAEATRSPASSSAAGFPIGAFSKEIADQELGRVRLVWTFGADGRWSEVPIALDGQTLKAPVVRGRYAVDGDSVTIATEYPPDWGTSRHRWRMDRGALWTAFIESDNPGDEDWFASLDTLPWTPYP
jgi:hypothetical protein